MTGTVHFDVPDTGRGSTARLHHNGSSSGRPPLLRPVSMEEADNSVNEIHESLPHRAAVRLYRQLSTGLNSKTIRCILVVSLGLNLIFAVLVGIFVGFWQSTRGFEAGGDSGGMLVGGVGGDSSPSSSSSSRSTYFSIPTKEQLYSCFPCSDDGVPGLEMELRSKNGVCCTTDVLPGQDNSNRMLQLTRDYVRARCPDVTGGSGRPQQEGREKPSAAHLTLDVIQSKNNLKLLPVSDHYLSWNVRDDTGVAFISEDLRYANGTITIPTNGRYHVYTHLIFDTNSNRLQAEQLVVDHSVTRISKGQQIFLLLDRVNLHTREIKSSDLEGTFELRQGDVLKVVVTYPSYLYNLPHTNVFGLFKLVSG